jgi:hypothetical protein
MVRRSRHSNGTPPASTRPSYAHTQALPARPSTDSHTMRTLRAHLGIFLGVLALLAAALPSWHLRTVLGGAVFARAVVIWRVLAVSVASRAVAPESTQSLGQLAPGLMGQVGVFLCRLCYTW